MIRPLLFVLALGALAGCGSEASSGPVPTKDDFKKTAPPPEYRGPGQPGGPSSGPVGGPGAGG
ncbi:hypothetical protein EON82_12385 [bacterium]|nr:MAG: hypothetical protein EON82_12385 [bacterium]